MFRTPLHMKTTTLAIVLLTAGFINAQAKPTPDQGKPGWLLKIFDLNGNGVLDPEERQAAKAALKMKREKFIAKWDTDKDGKLSRVEIAAIRADIRARIEAKRVAKFKEIAGDDDLISPAEFAAIPILAGKDPLLVTKIFNRLDKDTSDSISLDEFRLHRHVK
jgi:Ca2+-binding EF-hand superfamily protein